MLSKMLQVWWYFLNCIILNKLIIFTEFACRLCFLRNKSPKGENFVSFSSQKSLKKTMIKNQGHSKKCN